jgi:hypothetical protein
MVVSMYVIYVYDLDSVQENTKYEECVCVEACDWVISFASQTTNILSI